MSDHRHSPTTPAASATCWPPRVLGLRLPDRGNAGHGNNTGRKFGLQLLLRHHTPLRTKEGGSRARERNIGGSSGTGGPSGIIAQTDLSDWATCAYRELNPAVLMM